MKPLHLLSALEAARLLESGEIRASDLAAACLERIAARDTDVHAFVQHEPERVLHEAARADERHAGGELRGIPFAAKDIFDTVDYPTAYGSAIYAGHRPRADAACVAGARERGAVLVGKVATSEFATRTPAATRNPLRLSHTPGGSSSGSAAAVADCMVPVAFGSQTTGSIVRPAAYCGVVGYKPTFNVLPVAGMKVLSPSQDTVGVLSRTVTDAAFFIHGAQAARAISEHPGAVRIGLCTSTQWQHASDDAVAAIERFAGRLESAGATILRVTLARQFEDMVQLQDPLTSYEARRSLSHEYTHHADQLSAMLRRRLASGEEAPLEAYLHMLEQAAKARASAARLFDDVDVLLYPSADGEAEEGIEHSGSPRYGALWTLLHLPTVAVPIDTGRGGLPLGAQFVGPHAGDLKTLCVAHFASACCERLAAARAHTH